MNTPNTKNLKTLAIDIGGTGLKMMVVDVKGHPLTERTRVETPRPATPKAVIESLEAMLKKHGVFDRVSIGFPGVVKSGVVKTAPNLDPSWANFPLEKRFVQIVKKPTRVCNDADVQGFADITGQGVEMVITLGTGMGAALYLDGQLVPNLELGHHPFRKGYTYEELLGEKALLKRGDKKWNKNLLRAIELMYRIFNFDRLYIGGGNARLIRFKLPPYAKRSNNIAGLLGGVKLWQSEM